MQFDAKARYLRYSPYKLRPIADVIRGKNVQYVLDYLETLALKKAKMIKKVIASVASNAKNLKNYEPRQLVIKELKVDEGPVFRYFKPGAMGRANLQRKRSSHIKVVVEPIEGKEA